MAIIEAKDKENLQLKETIKTSKEMVEKHKEAYEKMREKHQKLKRKCGELYDQIEHMSNLYTRKLKNAVIDRLKGLMTLYEVVSEK